MSDDTFHSLLLAFMVIPLVLAFVTGVMKLVEWWGM